MNSSMRHTMRSTKGTTRRNITLRLAFMLVVLVLTLSACSQKSSQNEISVSNDSLSAPLPEMPTGLVLDNTNLVVGVVVDGGAPQICTGLAVDQGAGTYSCNITVPAGTHTITLVYSVSGTTSGTVELATVSGINVTVVAGQTTTADFSGATLTFTDTDGDGATNLAELDAGTDHTDPTDTPTGVCITDVSLIDNCTLG